MAINPQLLKALEDHKFKNGDVITYTSMNDEKDKKTITDVSNEIFKSITGSNSKDKMKILDAIFDGVYDVVENKSAGKDVFGLVDTKKGEFAELTIKLVKDVIVFSTKGAGTNIKLEFKIATPKTVENSTDWVPSESKKELQNKLKDIKTYKELEDLHKNIGNMLKTR